MRERESVAWFNGVPRVVSLFFTFEDRSSGERRRGKREVLPEFRFLGLRSKKELLGILDFLDRVLISLGFSCLVVIRSLSKWSEQMRITQVWV